MVKDLQCPHCSHSLIEEEGECEQCGSPIARLVISAQSKTITFFICTKIGCRWHGIPKSAQMQLKPKIGRQKKPEQDPLLRIHNFGEVSYGLTRELAMIEASRCLHCKKALCVEGCPVEIDIPGFIHLIAGQQNNSTFHCDLAISPNTATTMNICRQSLTIFSLTLTRRDDKKAAGLLQNYLRQTR